MVRPSRVNSRQKDYFNRWVLLVVADADQSDVAVIAATFERWNRPRARDDQHERVCWRGLNRFQDDVRLHERVRRGVQGWLFVR